MLNFPKKIFLFMMSKFGYNISKKVIIDKSNDPIWVAFQNFRCQQGKYYC